MPNDSIARKIVDFYVERVKIGALGVMIGRTERMTNDVVMNFENIMISSSEMAVYVSDLDEHESRAVILTVIGNYAIDNNLFAVFFFLGVF